MSTEEPQPIDWQAIGKSLAESMNQIVAALQPTFQSIITLAEHMSIAMWKVYREHGAIYGETQEGLLRWMEECGEINRLRAKADALEHYHEGLRMFNQRVAERREKQL